MTSPTTSPRRRIVVLRASRDTLALLTCTLCATLALAYAVRRHPEPAAVVQAPQPVDQRQVWAGQLAEVAPVSAVPAPAEPMTSASLVVPKATLALPPVAPARPARTPACDSQPCPAKAVATPARQKPAAVAVESASKVTRAPPPEPAATASRRFAFSDLNPLTHLPDAVRRPLNTAGAKLAGWIGRF